MSQSYARPKLKAKRNNNYALSTTNQWPLTGTTTYQGRAPKRPISESSSGSAEKSKKVCIPIRSSTSSTEGRAVAAPSCSPKQAGAALTVLDRGSGRITTANSRLSKNKEESTKKIERNLNNNLKDHRNSNNVTPKPLKIEEKSSGSTVKKSNSANARLANIRSRQSNELAVKDTPKNKRPTEIVDLVTPEIKENASCAYLQRLANRISNRTSSSSDSSSSTLVNESPLAQRLSTIKKSRNITVRQPVPETPTKTRLSHFQNTSLSDSFQVIEEIKSPTELEISTGSNRLATVVKKPSSLSQRLARIRNESPKFQEAASSKVKVSINRFDPPQVTTPAGRQSFVDSKCTDCQKKTNTFDWINTHQCLSRERETDYSISDSLVVNVDDTVLNKTDLLDPDDCSMEVDEPDSVETPTNNPSTTVPVGKPKENIVCVVADTNVFLHNLNKVKDIVSGKIPGSKKVIVYVPWMVVTELDYQKDHAREPLRSIALGAIRYINATFNGQRNDNSKKLIGQTVLEMSQQRDLGQDPDDKILSCAMQAAEKYEVVLLMSNDINLRNKAMINDIQACTPGDAIAKIKAKLSVNTKSSKIMHKLGPMCSSIICHCCKEAFGDAWSKMHMLNNPPWSFYECLKRFQKYWFSVFREKLLKQATKAIDDLLRVMDIHKCTFADDTEEYNQFIRLTLDLMVFLSDLKEFKGTLQNFKNDIINIAEGRST